MNSASRRSKTPAAESSTGGVIEVSVAETATAHEPSASPSLLLLLLLLPLEPLPQLWSDAQAAPTRAALLSLSLSLSEPLLLLLLSLLLLLLLCTTLESAALVVSTAGEGACIHAGALHRTDAGHRVQTYRYGGTTSIPAQRKKGRS